MHLKDDGCQYVADCGLPESTAADDFIPELLSENKFRHLGALFRPGEKTPSEVDLPPSMFVCTSKKGHTLD